MALTAGARLGPYEVLSPLGAGGMGEVYRARDTRLDRTVAIKVLPEQFSNNPDLKQRFEREARAISALNHPNICTLHDVGHEGGTDYLVMEYLEGESLAERIAKGPLPVEQVVKVGTQIADALDKAHRQGIVHRDLKPGNVMLTKSGAKLLDFGLAKAATAMGASSSPGGIGITQTSPVSPITQAGHVVGTFQYMAPEQVEGKEADARSDIFALGAVLYEMATGKRAFEGKSTFSVASAILEKDPEPISKVQPMTPPVLEYVVATCLKKDPEERFHTAHDVKLQLRWVLEGGSQAGAPAPVSARRKRRAWKPWGAAGALFAATVVLAYVAYREHSKVPTGVIQSWIEQPEKQVFAFTGDGGGPPAISPDGARVVYAAIDSTGKQHLWVRSLDMIAAQVIGGTDDATFPFWSPDSKKVGFFAAGSLKVVDLYGGSPLVVCPAAAGRGGTWNKDDVIVFSPTFTAGLYTVPATGGTQTQILDPTGTPFSSYRWPQFMPDGKHFLFLAVQHEKPSDSTLMFAALGGGRPKEIMKTGAAARYASGRLLYLRETALYAQAFDSSSGKVSGELSAVADQVLWDVSVWRGVFDASDNGELVYERGLAMTPTRLAWFDLTGKQLSTVDVTTGFANLDLTRDGKRLVAQGNPATAELWAYELSRGTRTRITFDAWAHTFPIWSPDNKWVAYVAVNPAGGSRICRKLADGSGDEEVLYESAKTKATTDWSPDGKYIVYIEPNDNLQGSGIWALPVEGERKPFPLLRTPFVNLNAKFSPDGKWIAFQSSESDRQEIYVVSFPKPTGKWQVSLEGGMVPQWTNDGSQIYFISTTTNQIMAADVSTKGGNFSVGRVKMDFPLTGSATLPWFALSPDGKSILAPAPTNEHQPPITLVTNWTAKVKK